MSLRKEYRDSLKLAEVEEPLDLILYRPVAFLLAKVAARTPITPNHITILSLLSGLAAAYVFAQWTPASLRWGGLLVAAANIFDCADGQLARMKKRGSSFGRLADGASDWTMGIAVFTALGLGLSRQMGAMPAWVLVCATGLSTGIHSGVFDFVQLEYLSAVRAQKLFLLGELDRINAELSQPGLRAMNLTRHGGLLVYRSYLTAQQRLLLRSRKSTAIAPEDYRSANVRAMRWWTLLGSSTDRTLLIIASLLGYPVVYCLLVAGPLNLYLGAMLYWKHRIDRRLQPSAGESKGRNAMNAPT